MVTGGLVRSHEDLKGIYDDANFTFSSEIWQGTRSILTISLDNTNSYVNNSVKNKYPSYLK
jgi:hypothetical protein